MDFIGEIAQNIPNEYRIKLYILKGIQLGMIYGSSEHKKIYQSIIDHELERLMRPNLPTPSLVQLEKKKKEILGLIQTYSHSSSRNNLLLHSLKIEFVRIMKEIEKIK